MEAASDFQRHFQPTDGLLAYLAYISIDKDITLAAMIPKAFLVTMVRPCRLRAPSHTRISTIKQQAHKPMHRQFSQTSYYALPRKDSQDKDSINTEATEYSKSATDDEGARQEDAAFNPDITDPQEQKDKAGEGTGGDTVSTSIPRMRRDYV